MHMPERKAVRRLNQGKGVYLGSFFKVQPEKAAKSQEEQNDVCGWQSLRLHFLAAQPQLRSGRRRCLDRDATVVNRHLGVQRKEEYQGTQPQQCGPPKFCAVHRRSFQDAVQPCLNTIRGNPALVSKFRSNSRYCKNSSPHHADKTGPTRTCDSNRVRLGIRLPIGVVAVLLLMLQAKAQTAYLGFDRNDYPGDAAMKKLRETYAFTGYWLNNPPGANRNTWQGHRATLHQLGYGFLVLFNGREYAYLKASGNAVRVGKSDGASALRAARREGFPGGAVLFLDQEQGGRMLDEQRAYIHAWVDAVVRGGYRAGVYCSGIPFHESSKVSVVTANDIRDNAGGRDIHFFVSNDQCPPAPGCVHSQQAPPPEQSGVEFAEAWQFAQSPRRPDMTASCRQTYTQDGNCYPPGMSANSGLYIDIDTAKSPDPSQARTR
jgi:Rv2525c-like, glycoside hydrolase-like domain